MSDTSIFSKSSRDMCKIIWEYLLNGKSVSASKHWLISLMDRQSVKFTVWSRTDHRSNHSVSRSPNYPLFLNHEGSYGERDTKPLCHTKTINKH